MSSTFIKNTLRCARHFLHSLVRLNDFVSVLFLSDDQKKLIDFLEGIILDPRDVDLTVLSPPIVLNFPRPQTHPPITRPIKTDRKASPGQTRRKNWTACVRNFPDLDPFSEGRTNGGYGRKERFYN